MISNTADKEVGMCSICGTVHVNDVGFYEDRACRECGSWNVYSIEEYRDIVNDWLSIKENEGSELEYHNEEYEYLV